MPAGPAGALYRALIHLHAVDAARGRSGKHKTSETAIVDQVTIVGTASKGLQRANIKTRLNRNPVIGDKFSSRHGQKGVLSVLWKDHDMPYCETTGMRCAPRKKSKVKKRPHLQAFI